MKDNYRTSVLLLIISSWMLVIPINAEYLGNPFIESNYSVEYEEVIAISREMELELEENSNQMNGDLNENPISYSFESDSLQRLMEEKFGNIVEEDYLEKLLINGDLTEIYLLALDHHADYSVEDVVLLEEDRGEDLTKQKWSFTLIEQPLDKSQKEQTWSLEATIYTSNKSTKLSYFKLKNKPYVDTINN